jgi:3-hydroxybutyryl-CoA dehydrogenase
MAALAKDRVVAVIGAGAMGAGIAQVAAQAGHRVLLFDTRAGAATAAVANIGKVLAGLVAKGRMNEEKRGAILANLQPIASLAEAAPAALVIEAIIEELAAKRALFAELEKIVAADAILATNTSSLSVAAMAQGLKHTGRVAGMHFFNPAPLLPLVEVVSALTTDRTIAETLFDTAAAWGKTPVHARSTPGFIVNRIARPFYAEALRVLGERAADPATIDAVMRESGGFRMGPCELMDLVGHDVNFAVTRSVRAAFFGDPRYQPSLVQQEMVEAGLLGRKTGRGFYDYAEATAKPQPRSEPPCPKPRRAIIEGPLGYWRSLETRIAEAGITMAKGKASESPAIRLDHAVLYPSDGRPATLRSERNAVVFDLALDFAKAPRVALAVSQRSEPEARAEATGLFQAIGCEVSLIDDTPGLIVTRTLAMLVNEAHEAVLVGVADAAAIDLAMTKGVNYPLGPLEWGARIGAAHLLRVLDNMAAVYGEDRYRASLALRRTAAREP